VGMRMERVFKMNNRTLLGISGLVTDVMTVHEELAMKCDLYKLREDREMSPQTFDSMVSRFLYSKRFGPYFVEPLIAGLQGPDFTPFISGQDVLGCPVATNDFVVAGTAKASLCVFFLCLSPRVHTAGFLTRANPVCARVWQIRHCGNLFSPKLEPRRVV